MISNTQIFWLYCVVLIPAFICSLFVLYHLLFDRTLRQSLHNHIIIIVLMIALLSQITVFPWMLYYYQYVGIWYRSPIFCIIWSFIDWAFYMLSIQLFAWCTIERHILIFHDQWVSTKKKRFFVHYLPPIIILLYWFIYYVIIYFSPYCESYFYDDTMLCMTPCIFYVSKWSLWDIIVNELFPIILVIVFSIGLFVRVVLQKRRMQRSIQWRKHRKMTIQVLSISFLYLVFLLPLTISFILYWFDISRQIGADLGYYAGFLSYYLMLLFPFVCLISLPELRTKFLKILHLRRHIRRTAPEPLPINVLGNTRQFIQ